MEVIKSNKGKPKLCFGGYMYTVHKTCSEHLIWRCSKSSSFKCKGTLHTTLENGDPSAKNPHNHPADDDSVSAHKSVQVMKERIKDTLAKPSQVFAEEVSKIEDRIKGKIPLEDHVKRTLRNHKKNGNPKTPTNLEELIIEGEWTLTSGPNPERFLLFDNRASESEDEGRIIIFCTDKQLEYLSSATSWYIDGNFSLAPPLFQQLYVVRLKRSGLFVTAAYVVLERKTERAYECMLQYILRECEQKGFYPEANIVYMDFEKATMNAVKSTLGDEVIIRGCFYHLCQSTHRKVQELGLQNEYLVNERLSSFVGMLDGLAFLPVDRVPEGMEFLRDHPDAATYMNLVDYFDQTYVTGTYRRVGNQQGGARFRRSAPAFPPETWNVNEAVIAGADKTNNSTEGWNNRFSHLVGVKHPSIWVLITKMKQELSVDYTKLEQLNTRPTPNPRKKPTYERLQTTLRSLCIEFNEGTRPMAQFLSAVGHTIRSRPN